MFIADIGLPIGNEVRPNLNTHSCLEPLTNGSLQDVRGLTDMLFLTTNTTVLIMCYRLMSDYEVTLVNDNSKPPCQFFLFIASLLPSHGLS